MKRIMAIIVFIFLISCASCNSLYKYGWLDDQWCLNNCTDENLKVLARKRIEEDRLKNLTPEQRFNKEMAEHEGKSKKEIILLLGVPSQIQNMEGLEILTYFEYKNTRSTYTPSAAFTGESKSTLETENTFTRADLIFENNKLIRWNFFDRP